MIDMRPLDRPRSASHMYHDSWRALCTSQVSAAMDPRSIRLTQSRRIPPWLWTIIAHSLSIDRQYYRRRLVVGLTLFLITMATCLCYTASSGFCIVYDIVSDRTRSTVFTGTLDSVMGLSWVSVAAYANYLAHRVFTTPALFNMVRLHTRKVFRVNIAVLIFLLAVAGLSVHLYSDFDTYRASRCRLVDLNEVVCKVRYVSGAAYGLMALYWNLIVAWSFLSVCRTQTIGCRRFIHELEFEGKVMEKLNYLRQASRVQDVCHEPSVDLVDDRGADEVRPSDFMSEVDDEEAPIPTNETAIHATRRRIAEDHRDNPLPVLEVNLDETESIDTTASDRPPASARREMRQVGAAEASEHASCEQSHAQTTASASHPHRTRRSNSAVMRRNIPVIFSQLQAQGVRDEAEFEKLLLSPDDICNRVWRINCNLRATSLIYQRWTATCLMFVGLWTFSYIIYWIKHNADFLQLANFAIPLTLAGLLCSGYAEVNLECSRIVRSICPRFQRLLVNRFLKADPPALMVYNLPLTYNIIGGAILGFIVALLSRIVMDEFNPS